MSDRTGVLFSRIDDPELVALAENLGYESAWAAEGQGKTAFGKLERWATATDDIELATGIVNVFSRSPAAVAQAIATLDDHSDGRAILGIGTAHPGVVEEFHGVEFERPLARIAEFITLIRRYLAGQAESFDGEFYTPSRTSFWEGFDPRRTEIPIYNAALGPSNVRLSGERADGWLPNLYPRGTFEQALEWLETGAERAGRNVEEVDVAMYLLTSVDDERAVAYDRAAEHVAFYLREIPGYYDRVAEEAGFVSNVEQAKNATSMEAAKDALSRELLDTLALVGTEADVRRGLREFRGAGVNLPIVRAPIGASVEYCERLLRTCAPE